MIISYINVQHNNNRPDVNANTFLRSRKEMKALIGRIDADVA